MAKIQSNTDLKVGKEKLSGCSAVFLPCIPSTTAASSANTNLKRPTTNEISSDGEEGEGAKDNATEENEIFSMLTEHIDQFLNTAREVSGWSDKLGTIATGMFASTGWIKSMSTGSKSAYEKLSVTKFEDIAKTAQQICAVMGKAHWAAAGLLVVAAVIQTIQKVKHVDRQCLELLGSINIVAKSLSRFINLPEIPEEMKSTVNEARQVIGASAACCLSILHSNKFRKFFCTPRNDEDITKYTKKLQRLQSDLNFQLIFADYAERHELRRGTQPKTMTPADKEVPAQKPGPSEPHKGIGAKEMLECINPFTWKCCKTIDGRDHPGENAPLTSDGDRKDAVSWIKEKLKLDNADTNDAIAVFICGDRDTGKFKLAEKVMSNVPKKVQWKTINVNTPDPNSAEGRLESYNDADFVSVLRLEILKKLEKKGQENRENKVDKEDQQKIENDQYWQKRLSQSLDAEKNVLIFIDNVSSAEVLQKILPKKLSKEKRIRLLLTIWDENVISAVDGTAFKREIYFIRPLSYTDALALFRKRNMLPTDRVNTHTVRKIIKICKGYRKQIKCLRDYLVKYYKDDEAFSRLSEWIKMKEPSYSELKRYFICEEKFLHLSYITRNAILDLCLFYSDWDWDEAACILDNDVLEKLKELDLLKRESKKVSVRDDVMTYCLSRARGSRITNVNDLHAALAKDKFHEIQGIFLLQNKIPFPLSSEQLDKMENLRVLALGDWTIVEGKCKTKFSHLRYFQAGSRVEKLPVDISMLDNLRFLDNNSHQSMGLTQENASPSLKLVKSKDLGFEHYVNLSKLPHGGELVELRIEGIEQDRLPKELCEFRALKKIKLTKCKNLSSLPKSFVRLRSLKILDLSHCAKLCALPSDFGWLSSLEKVNFSYCRALKDLPETMGLLSSVMEIDLSYCKKIEQLPKSLVKLSTLRVLKLRACAHLLELPEGFEELALQKLYLEACKRLKTLPKRVGQQPLEQKTVSLSWCLSVEEIPKGFISFIKEHVEHLNLVDCIGLEALPDEFPVELSRLRNLNLSGCRSLLRLPKRFHQLQNLEKLNLSSCEKLEESSIKLSRLPCLKEVSLSNCEGLKGSCLTSLTKIQSLTFVDIHNSPNLVDRWNQMKRDNKNCHFTVATERHGLDSRSFFHSLKMDSRADKELTQVSRIDKELKVGTSEFFRGKWFFVDANGQAFYPSSLEPGTTLAVILDRDPKKEEVKAMRQILDDLQTTSTFFQIIQIGTFVSAFQKELAGRHCVCTTDNYEAHVFFKKALSTVDSFDEKVEYAVIICDVQMSHEGQFFSAWRSITTENLKDITVAVPKAEFLQLKELADTPQHSNSRTLRALLLTSEIKFLITSRNQMDIKELKGKVVFLLLSWLHKFEEERPTFKCVYDKLKELHKESMFDFEVVWIPIVVHGRVTRADHARAVKEMPWPCIADPWSINPSAMQLFRIHPSFNKLPVLLAVYPNGQLHFENLISNEGEEVIEAPCQFEEEEVIRNLKEKIAKNCMEVTEIKERKNQPKQERLKLEEEITKKEKELVTKTLAQFIKDGHKKEQLD